MPRDCEEACNRDRGSGLRELELDEIVKTAGRSARNRPVEQVDPKKWLVDRVGQVGTITRMTEAIQVRRCRIAPSA